jgi:hypothetical protein
MDANTISELNEFYSALHFIIDTDDSNVSYGVVETAWGINDVVSPGSAVVKVENGQKTLEWVMFNRNPSDTINNITDTGHAVDNPEGFYLATDGFELRLYNLCNEYNTYVDTESVNPDYKNPAWVTG